MPTPKHKLERRLKPGTPYFWSVRARFQIGGETRLTDWSRTIYPYRPFDKADRGGEIPASNYFRFVTPARPIYQEMLESAGWAETLRNNEM